LQRQLQAQSVPLWRLKAATRPLAFAQLVGKASAFARLQAQQVWAQVMRLGQSAQLIQRLAFGAKNAIQAAKFSGV
jgi:hypothetical protein